MVNVKKIKLLSILSITSIMCSYSSPSNINLYYLDNDVKGLNNAIGITSTLLKDINNISGKTHIIKSVSYLDSLSTNKMLLASYYPSGYSVYDIDSSTIVEVDENAKLESTSNMYYVPLSGLYSKDELSTISNYNEYSAYNKSYFDSLKKDSENSTSDEKINLIEDEKIISVEFSKYFELNVNQFPGNYPKRYEIKEGYCGYTALALILGYNEFIKCHGYFSYEEENKYIIPAEDTMMINKVPEIIDDFLPEVFGDKLGSSYSDKIKYAAETFLQNKSVNYYLLNINWYLGDLLSPIYNHDEPVILFASIPDLNYGEDTEQKCNHAVVVY